MERLRRRRCLLLLLAAVWPAAAAAAAAAEACHDGDHDAAHAGCVDASGLARHHGAVWRERAGRRAGGGCVRRVSACVAGRLLRPVPDRVEYCPHQPAANRACRMESFFTCCPVYDCPSKLASLIAPLSPGQDPRSPLVGTFLSRLNTSDVFNARPLTLPVAHTQLNATAIRQLLGLLSARRPSAEERAVRAELRSILSVLETPGAPPEPSEARAALDLLRRLTAARQRVAARLLGRLLAQLDAGRLQRPLTQRGLLNALLEVMEPGQLGVVADVVKVVIQLQLDSRETPFDELLRYVVLYLELDTGTEQEQPEPEPQPEEKPEPDSRTAVGQACSENQEGLVWAEMEPAGDGRCTRHVRACRGGRVVSSAGLRGRQHVCDVTGPELCRIKTGSFFTCCPVFDCQEKLRYLNETPPADLPRDSLTPAQFQHDISPADMASVKSPVPIVDRALHIKTVIAMRNAFQKNADPSAQELKLRGELDQIVELFQPDYQAEATVKATNTLRWLVQTLNGIGFSVLILKSNVVPQTTTDMLLASHRLTELRAALESRALPESAVPEELPRTVARVLMTLTSAERSVQLRTELRQLMVSVSNGTLASGPQLVTLIGELRRVLDVWLDVLPAAAFGPLPELSPPPASLTELLWRLLAVGADVRPAPLLPPAGPDGEDDGPLLEAVTRLVERLRQSGEPTGPLRPALVRLVRQLTLPDGRDSPEAVRLLLELVQRATRGPTDLQPRTLQALADLLGRLGGLQRPAAAPHTLRLLIVLVENLTPRHQVISAESRATLVELLQILSARPTAAPEDLRLLVTVVRQLGEMTRIDVRPEMIGHLMTLLSRMDVTNPAGLQPLVRLIVQLRETQPSEESGAGLRLLLQLLGTLVTEPEGAPQEPVRLVIQLVQLLEQPGAEPEVMRLLTQLIGQLQRPPPQLVQLVVQLAQRHGPAAELLRPLLLALLSAQEPHPTGPEGLLQALIRLVDGAAEGRMAQDGGPQLRELLMTLVKMLVKEQKPLSHDVRQLLVQLSHGAESNTVSEEDIMAFVLAMLELLSREPTTPTVSVGFNISTVVPEGPDPDFDDLSGLIALLFGRDPDGKSAGPTERPIVPTAPPSEEQGTDQLLSLLFDLLGEENEPAVPDLINITAVLTDGGQQVDFSEIRRLIELLIARIGLRKQQPGYVNITGTIVEEESDSMEDIVDIIRLLLARMSAMADKPREPEVFNITLIDDSTKQFDEEFIALLEGILDELSAMEQTPQPTGILDISVVDDNRKDYTKIRELLTMLMLQLTSMTEETPQSPGFINISLVQQDDGDQFRRMSYLLELLMSQLGQESVAQPGSLNISIVPGTAGRDDSGDILALLELILAEMDAKQTADVGGFLNISGVLVDGRQTDVQGLRAILESVMSRMSGGGEVPSDDLSTFRELISAFFSRPSDPQPIDIPGIVTMLIDLGELDNGPTLSTADFIQLIRSLNVPQDHPTFADDIRRLVVLLQQGSRSASYRDDLTNVVISLLQLLETTGNPTNVPPEMLVRFIIRQTSQPADSGLDELLTALLGLLEGGAELRTLPPPPDSLPASLRDLVVRLQLQMAESRPPPLLQSLPQLLQLLTELRDSRRPAPDTLQFAAQLAAAVLDRTPNSAGRVLLPQIQLHLRQLTREPSTNLLMTVISLLQRLRILEQQRQPTDVGLEGSVTIITDGASDDTDLMVLLQDLLDSRDTGNEASSDGFSDLLDLLTPSGRRSPGERDAPLDFATWLTELLGGGSREDRPEVSRSLLTHLVDLLRRRQDRPDLKGELVSPEDATRVILLLSGERIDPAAVPVSALHAILSLLDPNHTPRPTDTPPILLQYLLRHAWGATGRPDPTDPSPLYRRLLTALTGRPADQPASEAALRRALLLLLAGADAAEPTADTEEATRLLVTLVVQPKSGDGGGDPRLVPTAVLRVMTSLLESASAGGRPVAASEDTLRALVRLLTEPQWRGPQAAPDQLVRLLVTAATAAGDSGRQGAREMAVRLLLRLVGAGGARHVIPVMEDSLRDLLATPDSRSGGGSDSDSDEALRALTRLLSDYDPSRGDSSVPDDVMTAILGGGEHDEHQEHADPSEHSEEEHEGEHPPLDSVFRLLTVMMTGDPAGGESTPAHPLFGRLLSLLGERDFDPASVPASVHSELTALLSAEDFDPAAAAASSGRLLASLGGGQLPAGRLFRRLLLLLASRGGLPTEAVTPPDRLLRRCRLLCDAAGPHVRHSTGVQLLPGRTPITFVGENHVIVVNG